MSHGPSSEGSAAEPNLVPLLDVVMQLLMFFMMCVNFVNEQVSRDVKLPLSQVAAPMNKGETDVLFVNLKAFDAEDYKSWPKYEAIKRVFGEAAPGKQQMCALIVGKDEPFRPIDLRLWLESKYKDAETDAKKKAEKDPKLDGKVQTVIILRADRALEYEHIYAVMKMCEEAGFPRLKLRAIIKNKGTA